MGGALRTKGAAISILVTQNNQARSFFVNVTRDRDAFSIRGQKGGVETGFDLFVGQLDDAVV